MKTPVSIPLHEWSENMHSLDKAIRNCANDEEVLYFADTLEYGHNIPNNVIFIFHYDGGDFGSDQYFARFYKIL